jgi:hypothetical protein
LTFAGLLPESEATGAYPFQEVFRVNCPHCGETLACAACGTVVSVPISEVRLDGAEREAAAAPPAPDQTFLVVAKRHGDLLEQLQEVVGDLGWVTLIKDRRDDPTILPREGRDGTVHVDQDLSP